MEKNYWPQYEILTRRILSDKPVRLDTLMLWTRWCACKVRPSKLKQIILEQQHDDAKKRKGKA